MSEQTLAAKQELIDKQAEAAKAAEVVAEVENKEIQQAIDSLPVTESAEEQAEEDEDILWLRSELSAIRTQLQELRDSQDQQLQNLSSQLLQSMTEVFTTAVATLQTPLIPQPSLTPEVVTVQEPVSAAQTPESAEVPSEAKAQKKRRAI